MTGTEPVETREPTRGFKARVALMALRTVSELANASYARPTMIHQWNNALLHDAAGIPEVGGKADTTAGAAEKTGRDLHARIGGLAVACVSLLHSLGP